jgi:23S rRNA pseudouridine2605 synthase
VDQPKIEIPNKIRLAKEMAKRGISRRQAEQCIQKGRVHVNGNIILTPIFFTSSDDTITVDGLPIERPARKVWSFYKKVGLITSHQDPQSRPTVFDFLKINFDIGHVLSVGRLDINSEGLLLLSNDPSFIHEAEHPKNNWIRLYRVRFLGHIKPLLKLTSPLVIDGVVYRITILDIQTSHGANHWATLELREGKNREIRKIFEFLKLKVNRLIRIQYGSYHLGSLKPGNLRTEI